MVDFDKPQFCLFYFFPEGLVLELNDFFQFFIIFLVQIQVQDLYIFELGRIVQSKSALPVRVNQQLGVQLTSRLLDPV